MFLHREITEQIIASAIEVHKALGPGLLESAYEKCLVFELSHRGLSFKVQEPVPINYKDTMLDCGFRSDIVVDDKVIVELKSVDKLIPVHSAQMLTYLKLMNLPVGLLINFNVRVLKDGIKRYVL